MGYCNWSSASLASALTFTCGRDNLKSFSCFHPKFVLHVTNDHFSDKFNNGWKNSKWPTYCDFSPFTSIIWPCGRDNLKSFSRILFKFVMHVTNDQFSDKFNNGKKKKKWPIYCNFSHFTSIIWEVFHISFSNLLCMLLMTSSRTSSIMAEKKKMADLLRFFTFYVNNLTLWAR